jgi:hypothetical protein
MNHLVVIDAATRYERISKQQARKRFDAGESFYIIAHKMRPGMPFSLEMTIDSKHYQEENRTFDRMVTEFCWYNANCHETGTYAAFYLELPGWSKS